MAASLLALPPPLGAAHEPPPVSDPQNPGDYGVRSGYCQRESIDSDTRSGRNRSGAEGRAAAGTVIGSVLGHAIDRRMDERDRFCAGRALDFSADGTSVGWLNPEQDLNYLFTPLRTFRSAGGLVCREFRAASIGGSSRYSATGVACRQPSGHWLVRG